MIVAFIIHISFFTLGPLIVYYLWKYLLAIGNSIIKKNNFFFIIIYKKNINILSKNFSSLNNLSACSKYYSQSCLLFLKWCYVDNIC